ncbi:MAG: hypothetical protein HXY42_06185 [Chloroflexi bacterium]|nr:hypothetical protein [Chloroflexota bacterium]
MKTQRTAQFLFVFTLLLSACARQTQPVLPTATLPPSAPTSALPTETPTDIPTAIPTEPLASADPTLFGALAKSEINPLAGKIHEAIFIKVMDSFVASEDIIEYQIVASEVFPASDGTFIAEIYYNVRTTDPAWLADGGVQADDDWIQNKCNRFDFVNTETEFQLRNRRTCN